MQYIVFLIRRVELSGNNDGQIYRRGIRLMAIKNPNKKQHALCHRLVAEAELIFSTLKYSANTAENTVAIKDICDLQAV